MNSAVSYSCSLKKGSGVEELENWVGDRIQLVLLRRHYFQASLSDYNNLKYETFLVAGVKMLGYRSLNSVYFYGQKAALFSYLEC